MRTYEELVQLLTDLEMDETTHPGDREEYDTAQDFYLENIKSPDYVSYFLQDGNFLTNEEKDAYDLEQMRQDVIDAISEDVQ